MEVLQEFLNELIAAVLFLIGIVGAWWKWKENKK